MQHAYPYRIRGADGEPILRYPLQAGILLHALSLEDLEGMTKHYDEEYGHETSVDVLDMYRRITGEELDMNINADNLGGDY